MFLILSQDSTIATICYTMQNSRQFEKLTKLAKAVFEQKYQHDSNVKECRQHNNPDHLPPLSLILSVWVASIIVLILALVLELVTLSVVHMPSITSSTIVMFLLQIAIRLQHITTRNVIMLTALVLSMTTLIGTCIPTLKAYMDLCFEYENTSLAIITNVTNATAASPHNPFVHTTKAKLWTTVFIATPTLAYAASAVLFSFTLFVPDVEAVNYVEMHL